MLIAQRNAQSSVCLDFPTFYAAYVCECVCVGVYVFVCVHTCILSMF